MKHNHHEPCVSLTSQYYRFTTFSIYLEALPSFRNCSFKKRKKNFLFLSISCSMYCNLFRLNLTYLCCSLIPTSVLVLTFEQQIIRNAGTSLFIYQSIRMSTWYSIWTRRTDLQTRHPQTNRVRIFYQLQRGAFIYNTVTDCNLVTVRLINSSLHVELTCDLRIMPRRLIYGLDVVRDYIAVAKIASHEQQHHTYNTST